MPLFWEAFFTFKPCQAQDIAHNLYLTVTNPVSLALRQLMYLYSISSLILHMKLVIKSCYLFLYYFPCPLCNTQSSRLALLSFSEYFATSSLLLLIHHSASAPISLKHHLVNPAPLLQGLQ